MTSFLRWVGGKRLLAQRMLAFLPNDARERRYVEPFVGAGSLFFALQPRKAVLSDLNGHLVDCYRAVRDKPRAVAASLNALARANGKRHYYRIRKLYNRTGSSAAQAARFIYLNHTCFNGVFRVNTDGSFNVPFGDKPNPQFPSHKELARVSATLKKASLRTCDYHATLKEAQKGDLVYLDPPYPPLNGTAYFTHYTADRFSLVEQRKLAKAFRKLHRRGCLLIMTNADTPLVRGLYRGFSKLLLNRPRYVTCKKVKHQVGELVITNYVSPRKKRSSKEAA